jgi:hypothetical protein
MDGYFCSGPGFKLLWMRICILCLNADEMKEKKGFKIQEIVNVPNIFSVKYQIYLKDSYSHCLMFVQIFFLPS